MSCVLTGVTDTLTHRLHGRRAFTVQAVEKPVAYFLSVMSPILLIVFSIWLWATFFSLCILRLLHHNAGFDLLACLNGYALAPLLLAGLADPVRSLNRTGYWLWQTATAGMLVWFVAALWIGLAAECHIAYGQAILAAAPAVLCLVTAGVLYGRTPPDTYRAVHFWRRAITDHLVIYYDRKTVAPPADEIVQGCAATLQSVVRFLEVELPPYPIEVFLYSDEALRQRMAGNTNRFAWAAADSIHLPFDDWSRMRGTVAHELTHVMREQRITRTPVALLEEGLATCTEANLVRGSTVPPCITIRNSLHVLANQTVFYEWLYTQASENTWSETYAHAHALTRYLIQTHGMKSYKALCSAAGSAKGTDAKRLCSAVQTVYRLSLKELEQAWRNECDIVHVGPRMAWAWLNQAMRDCITDTRLEAVGAGLEIASSERLLARLLQDKRYGSYRLLVKMKIDISAIQHRITAISEPEARRGTRETVFSEPVRSAMDQAVKEAVRQNAHFVGTDHLLLGFLLAGEGHACDILTAVGFNLTGARAALSAMCAQIAAEQSGADKTVQEKSSPV